jgi:hypothetical protein
MSRHITERNEAGLPERGRCRASARFKAGPLEAEAEVDITPAGLVAIGTLVSMILLSVAPIIRAANRKVPPAD